MRHVQRTIEELRRYIARQATADELEDVDVLLSVALEEVRRKLGSQPRAVRSGTVTTGRYNS